MSIRMTMQVLKKVGKNKRLVSSEPSPTFKTLLQNKTTESFITRGVAIVIQPPHAVPGCGGVCARHIYGKTVAMRTSVMQWLLYIWGGRGGCPGNSRNISGWATDQIRRHF